MKYLEVSQKIVLARPATAAEIKQTLMQRLERAIDIESAGDGDNHFSFSGTTGAPTGIVRHAWVNFDADITVDDGVARLVVSGYTRMARSQVVFYTVAFALVLLLGLLPGAISTGYDSSDAGDVMVLLVLGIFVIFDVGRKLIEPRELLEAALNSVEALHG